MRIILPVRIEECSEAELRIIDAEDQVLCIVLNETEAEITPSEMETALFICHAFNLECPRRENCQHANLSDGCDAGDCAESVEVDI